MELRTSGSRIAALTAFAGLTVSIVAAGCSSDGGGGNARDGGSASITRIVIGTNSYPAMGAEFYSDILGEPTEAGTVPLDGCADAATVPTGSFGAPVYRSVGDTVTFTTGASTFVANVSLDGEVITYGAAVDDTFPLGVDYTVTLDDLGFTLNGLHMPADIGANLTAPSIVGGATEFPNAALDLVWTPAGADEISVFLSGIGENAPAWICRARDDGAFTVPANVVSAVPSTGNFGIYAFSLGVDQLGGRSVGLFGATGTLVTYTRN